MECKNVKPIESESRMVADRGARGNGEMLVKVIHFQLQDQLSSGDLIYSQMTLVNDTVLHP